MKIIKSITEILLQNKSCWWSQTEAADSFLFETGALLPMSGLVNEQFSSQHMERASFQILS